jgi:hypothetical protein
VLAAHFGESSIRDIVRVLEAWMEFVRTEGHQLAYVSNLVVAQRFIAMSLAWGQIGGLDASDERTRCENLLLRAMGSDAAFLVPRVGDSVANNHLLVDGFIGWYVCALLPELEVTRGRLPEFERLFLSEIGRQILPDGTGFEHSVHYHEMCCELACTYLIWCRNNGIEPPVWLTELVRRMLEFQMTMAYGRDKPWAIGDATEDPMLPIDPGGWSGGAMRELYRGLFDPSAEGAQEDDISAMRAYWLLGGLAERGDCSSRTNTMQVYGDGGFVSFVGIDKKHQVVFRTGPADRSSIFAGHMHADLLSIYVAVDGEPFIVDSGTYSYRRKATPDPTSARDWRAYLMGPLSHNGVCIDGVDPLGAVMGDFRPNRCDPQAKVSRLISTAKLCGVEAVIESKSVYGGFSRGVLCVDGEYFVVYDRRASGTDAGSCSYGFQFDTNVEVVLDGLVCRAQSANRGLWLHACEDLHLQDLACGRVEPPGGWVSVGYGLLTPAPQIRYRARAGAPVTAFLLRFDARDSAVDVQARVDGDALFFRVDTPQYTDYVVLPGSSGEAGVPEWSVRFRGKALWLRDTHDGSIRVRWAGGSWVEHETWRLQSQDVEVMRELDASYAANTATPGRIAGAAAELICVVPVRHGVGIPTETTPRTGGR